VNSTRVISDPLRVYTYVSRHMPMQPVGGMKGIGLERGGELEAGVLYEGFNGQNVWMHVAAEPGSSWMTRGFLRYSFEYPFNEMGVKRVSGYVSEGNAASRRLVEHLGFKPEARLKQASEDGSDVIIYSMWRDDCRFLGERYGR